MTFPFDWFSWLWITFFLLLCMYSDFWLDARHCNDKLLRIKVLLSFLERMLHFFLASGWDIVIVLRLVPDLFEWVLCSPYCRTRLAPLLKRPFWGLCWMCRCFSDLPNLAHWNLDVSQFCVSMENHIAYTFSFFWLKRMLKQVSWFLPRCRTFLSSVLPCKFQLPPRLWSLSFLVSKTTVVCQGSPFLCYCPESDLGRKRGKHTVHLFVYLPWGSTVLGFLFFGVCKYLFVLLSFPIELRGQGTSQVRFNPSWLKAKIKPTNLIKKKS